MTTMFQNGPAALISALYEELNFGKIIDRMVNWDEKQCHFSPGERVKVMVINIFSHRRPLYRIDEAYRHMDIENLFGRGISLDDLKDYNMARALDKIAERGAHEIFSTLCLEAISSEQLSLKYLHSDTTSISVHGDYEYAEATDPYFFITFGHSKAKRPDLKQFLYGVSVNEDGVPVCADVVSGNTSDKTWNFNYIEKLAAKLKPEMLAETIYIADSALVTEANLIKLKEHSLRFISRLPGNFNLEEELKERAWAKNSFEELGVFSERKDAASYKVTELNESLYEDDYRFLIVHSSKLDKRKTKSFDRSLSETEKKLGKIIEAKEKIDYACLPDAETALNSFIKDNRDKHYLISGQVASEEKRKPGRPGKGNSSKTVYRLRLNLKLDEKKVAQTRERLSCFILISNLDQSYSTAEILKQYKAQNKVETSFKFLKDPLLVGPIFLKKPSRVEALAYLLLIALLIFYILQRRVRKALETEDRPLLIPGKVETFKPTGKKILESVEVILTMTTGDPHRRAFSTNYKLPRVISLAGFDGNIYLNVKEREQYFP